MWTDLSKATSFYQCFTLSARNVKTVNPQRATGARDFATISCQTRDDTEQALDSKTPPVKLFTTISTYLVSLNIQL